MNFIVNEIISICFVVVVLTAALVVARIVTAIIRE